MDIEYVGIMTGENIVNLGSKHGPHLLVRLFIQKEGRE